HVVITGEVPGLRAFRPVNGLALTHGVVVRIGILHRSCSEQAVAVGISDSESHPCPQARSPTSISRCNFRVCRSPVTLLGITANFDSAALAKPHCGQMPSRLMGAYFAASS